MEGTKNYEFRVPPVILTGAGCSRKVGAEARALGGTKALLVTGKVVRKLGYADQVRGYLEDAGLQVEIFDGVLREPEIEFVENGFKVFKEAECDLVVGLGGGSPMDAAKGIAVLASCGGSIRDYEGLNRVPRPKGKLILMPTTSGSGSEVSMYSIITDVQRKRKMVIKSPNIIADAAICDPLFTLTVPPDLTMGTGVDALTHAIEAYVSVRAQPITDRIALAAIRLISENLRQAWANGDNLEARSNMMLGATLAAMCHSNSSVALVHGMSRPIGANFHLPHGLSNAILLPIVMEFSYIGDPRKYADIAVAMGEKIGGLTQIDAARRSVEAVKKLCADINVPSLSEVGASRSRVIELAPKMAEDAIASGSPANNPRKATKEDIIRLYKKAAEIG
jgi:alcohol dehydrogenase class IV